MTMTDSMQEAFRELVFGYEDLEPTERLRADRHLSVCSRCQALLDALRCLEGEFAARRNLPPEEDHPFLRLSSSEHQEERESLSALRRRLREPRLQLLTLLTRSSPRVETAVQDPARPWPGRREPEER